MAENGRKIWGKKMGEVEVAQTVPAAKVVRVSAC